MNRKLPTFLIIGAAKSGTSSLWHYLREHPEVFVPQQKELNFFSDEGVFARGADWYASLFVQGHDKKAIGEASPAYLFSEDAIRRIASLIPDVRLVASLRNPIDRAYSHYLHALAYTIEERPFREVVDAERRAPDGVWPFYLAQSRYLPQLERVTEHFSREQLLVLLLDDLVSDPIGTFRRLCRHVGIDPLFVPDNVGEVTNAYRESRATPLLKLWIRTGLQRRIPQRIWRSIGRLFLREGRSPEPIDPDVRRELASYFEEDNAALGRWLGRDLSMWR